MYHYIHYKNLNKKEGQSLFLFYEEANKGFPRRATLTATKAVTPKGIIIATITITKFKIFSIVDFCI